jgi:hypothetical protein
VEIGHPVDGNPSLVRRGASDLITDSDVDEVLEHEHEVSDAVSISAARHRGTRTSKRGATSR